MRVSDYVFTVDGEQLFSVWRTVDADGWFFNFKTTYLLKVIAKLQ